MRNEWIGATAVVALLTAAAAAPAAAQLPATTRVGIGYVANAPALMGGAAGYIVLPAAGGLGIYVDAKFDASNPSRKSNFIEDLTAADVENDIGDQFFDSAESWRSFDVAIVRPVRPALMIYAGAGYARRRKYNEYLDASGSRGTSGNYWVEDTAARSSKANLLGGVFLRLSRYVNAQFGVESAPTGATVGLSLALPPC